MSVSELNEFLYAYSRLLPSGEKYRLHIANSIWFNEATDFHADKDFLQTNADWYGASLFRLPFNDSAGSQINEWVKKHTDGMIDKILDRLSEDAVMYLVNALSLIHI